HPPIAAAECQAVTEEVDNTIKVGTLDGHFIQDFKEDYLATIKSVSILLDSELTAVELSGAFPGGNKMHGASSPAFPPPHCLTRYEWRSSAAEEPADRARHLDLSIRSLHTGLRSGKIEECMIVLPPTSYMGGRDNVTVII
ncbi:hypothetical protein Pmar_PMAR026326, partial [Perkinsus marinus ATCC 50983]